MPSHHYATLFLWTQWSKAAPVSDQNDIASKVKTFLPWNKFPHCVALPIAEWIVQPPRPSPRRYQAFLLSEVVAPVADDPAQDYW
jgi:hypothetical protein